MQGLRRSLPAALLLLVVLTTCQGTAEEDIFTANRELLQTDGATANPGIAVGEPNPSAPGGCPECHGGINGWPHGGWGWPKPKPEPRPIPLPHPIPNPKPDPYPKPKPGPYPIGRKMLGSDSAGTDKFGGGGRDDGGYGWKPKPIPVDPPPRGNPGWGWPKPGPPGPPEPRPYPLPHPIKNPGMITIDDCHKGPC